MGYGTYGTGIVYSEFFSLWLPLSSKNRSKKRAAYDVNQPELHGRGPQTGLTRFFMLASEIWSNSFHQNRSQIASFYMGIKIVFAFAFSVSKLRVVGVI